MLWSVIPLVCPTNSFTGDIVFRMSQSCVQTSLYIHIVCKAILLKKKNDSAKANPLPSEQVNYLRLMQQQAEWQHQDSTAEQSTAV